MAEILKTVFFRNAAGEVHEVTLPEIEARGACNRHPHEWSASPDKFAEPPEGDGAGADRADAGASVRVD